MDDRDKEIMHMRLTGFILVNDCRAAMFLITVACIQKIIRSMEKISFFLSASRNVLRERNNDSSQCFEISLAIHIAPIQDLLISTVSVDLARW